MGRAESLSPLPRGAVIAAVVSAAMIANQVAGKAARDALFLSRFDVTALPAMMAVAALLSLAVAPWLSNMILRHSPRRVVTVGFAVSAVGLLLEWAISASAPGVAAVLFYLHCSLFGSTSISAFWSFINEKFDPHTGKRASNWISGGGSIGGILGGVLAWRAAPAVAVSSMLLFLVAFNLLSLWGLLQLRTRKQIEQPEAAARPPQPKPAGALYVSGFRALRETPYLRNLTLIVVLGAVASGLLEYVFSVKAVAEYAEGGDLLAFFALFWLSVGVASLALQILIGRLALEKLGLAMTIGLLPGAVIIGGCFGIALPGLWSAALLRGAEASHRNSLFRAAYELLYTPLSEQKRRSTKLLIDIGADRVGTLIATGLVALALVLGDSSAVHLVLLCVTIVVAMGMLARTGTLRSGYTALIEGSLQRESSQLPSPGITLVRTASETTAVRDDIVDHQQELERRHRTARKWDLARVDRDDAVRVDFQAALRDATHLCSSDPMVARSVLCADTPLSPALVWFAIVLLDDDELHLDARSALVQVASSATGQLADALCNSAVPINARRRLARVLGSCHTQLSAEALILGTRDERFEVRFECGQALFDMTGADSEIIVSLAAVVDIVTRELAVGKDTWERQQRTLQLDDLRPGLVARLLRDRTERSLEHIFTILALAIDRDSLRLAFRAMHEHEPRLRGTALEYLDTVLPANILAALLPFLGEHRPMRSARSAQDILADLSAACDELDRTVGAPEDS